MKTKNFYITTNIHIPIENCLIRLNYESDIVYNRDSKGLQVCPLVGVFYCLTRP